MHHWRILCSRRVLIVALMAMHWSCGLRVEAEILSVKLPVDASDFALHPETGDLVALDVDRHRALLFRRDDLQNSKMDPAAETNVGPTPVSICFKAYQDAAYFAVVCTQDAHLYLLDAKTLSLKKKISLTAAGVSQVTGSRNPEDPFLYYNYGSGHDSKAGAVDLRALVDRGAVFDQSMDCAISANGLYAYRRGPWSPSGFEALMCTNGLHSEKPAFSSVHREHTSTAAYLPDPHNQYTAAGNGLFSATLQKRLASFDFVPLAFATQRPLIFGVTGPMPGRPTPNKPVAQTLVVASYNSFTKIGVTVPLPFVEAKDGQLPRGVPGQADFKQVGRRSRLLVDDTRARILFAERTQVHMVPWNDFELPDEPLILARLDGPRELNIGETYTLKIQLADPRVQSEADLLPDGATYKNGVVTWQPTRDQLGEAALEFSLKHAELQNIARHTVQVVTPSIKLPFPAGSVTVDDSGLPIIVSSASPNSRNIRPGNVNGATGTSQIASVDEKTRKVLATATINRPLRTVVAAQDLLLLTFLDDPSAVDIYDRTQLKRLKSLIASGPVAKVRMQDDGVVVTSPQLVEVFDKSTWKRRLLLTPSNPGANGMGGDLTDSKHGVVIDGVLRNLRGEPLLLVSPFNLPTIGQTDGRVIASLFGAEDFARAEAARAQQTAVPVPGTGLTAAVAFTTRPLPNTNRLLGELALIIGGSETDRILLDRAPIMAQSNSDGVFPPPALGVGSQKVAVVHGQQLYLWNFPAKAADEPVSGLEWTAKQSTFVLQDQKPTVLKHEVRGGRAPYQFVLQTPMEGITIDEQSGEVRAEWSVMRPIVESQLVSAGNPARRAQDALQSEGSRQQLAADLKRRLNVEIKGLPVTIPVRIRVTDADDRSLTLQYLVIADVSPASIQERLQAANPPRATAKPGVEGGAGPENGAESPSVKAELERLNTRLDKLETRLDLIIKLLSKSNEKP